MLLQKTTAVLQKKKKTLSGVRHGFGVFFKKLIQGSRAIQNRQLVKDMRDINVRGDRRKRRL